MTYNVWNFDNTNEAYDSCMANENIKEGDVLVIASEKVVGIAYAWPFAITKEWGALHFLKISAHDFCVKNDLNLDALACAEKFIESMEH